MITTDGSNATAADALPARIEVRREGGATIVVAEGDWLTRTVGAIDASSREVEADRDAQSVVIDLSKVGRVDTGGAWIIERLAARVAQRGGSVEIRDVPAAVTTLLKEVAPATHPDAEVGSGRGGIRWMRPLEATGKAVTDAFFDFIGAMNILGATFYGPQMKVGRGRVLGMAAFVHQLDRSCISAAPIVMLISVIIGAIIAQQAAYQLRYFGAEMLVIDFVAVLVLRELGVLLTAILIAGRSGSSITAEIGAMNMREEIDALKVMGLNPIGVLVFPRLVALMIGMPLLTIAAEISSLAGAIIVAWFYSDITPAAFLARVRGFVDMPTVVIGVIKAPFMGLIIGVIAAVEGMNVRGSTESLGRHVTASVVKAIFVVIVADGLFAMFYAAVVD